MARTPPLPPFSPCEGMKSPPASVFPPPPPFPFLLPRLERRKKKSGRRAPCSFHSFFPFSFPLFFLFPATSPQREPTHGRRAPSTETRPVEAPELAALPFPPPPSFFFFSRMPARSPGAPRFFPPFFPLPTEGGNDIGQETTVKDEAILQ